MSVAKLGWLALAAGVAIAAVVVVPALSDAKSTSTVTIVGTSDVVDSNLLGAVLKPGFEAAYPKYTLHYVSQGSGAAITTAEAGAADGLLVHAASLENQFVADGYSEEQYGRAAFYGDYVLLGPTTDPAGVLTHAPHDIVTALERIASAPGVNFVSRGGTPGTTVKEHAIWALTHGVTTCTVSTADGGGAAPSTAGGACPATITSPSWYHATGLNQGPNVTNADVCAYAGGDCYVLTDRGTFQYLQSTNAISNLEIMTRDNKIGARGGSTMLINSFHVYALNPAKFASHSNVHLNLAGAQAFLNWVTSPGAQRSVGRFEAGGGDPPFLPAASPSVKASLPGAVTVGHHLVVHGSLTNKVPGAPLLADVRVTLTAQRAGHAASVVDTARTGTHGRFELRYRPRHALSYAVSTRRISQVESATLDPVFGELLAPTSTSLGQTQIRGVVTLRQPTETGGEVRLAGHLAPAVVGSSAHLAVYAGTSKADLKRIRTTPLIAGERSYATSVRLKPGRKWAVEVRYVDPGVLAVARSTRRTLVV